MPEIVVDAVVAITKADGEDYLTYINRVQWNLLARIVKIADILDNLDDKSTKTARMKYRLALYILIDDIRWLKQTMPDYVDHPELKDICGMLEQKAVW